MYPDDPKLANVPDRCKQHMWTSDATKLDNAPLSFMGKDACSEMRVTHVCLVISFVCYTLRYLQFYTVSQSMGPKIKTITGVLSEMIFFVLLFFIAILSYGVAVQSLVYMNERDPYNLLSGVLIKPFFSMFGETFMGELTEYKYSDVVDDCLGPQTNLTCNTVGCLDEITNFGESFRNFTEVRCPDKHKLVWFLMAIFQVFGNALLLNLLVAMFSNTFDEIQQNAALMWRYQRYSLLENYHTQPPFPPPLNLLYYYMRFILWTLSACRYKSMVNFEQFKKPIR